MNYEIKDPPSGSDPYYTGPYPPSTIHCSANPNSRQNPSTSATVSAEVRTVFRSRISALNPAAKLEASATIATHLSGL
jgi:hypothetical protein